MRGEDAGGYLKDAASTSGGSAPLAAFPRTEGEAAWVLRAAPAVLAIGAQSSLTGGATPRGEWLLATENLARLDPPTLSTVRCGAGVALRTLQQHLAAAGRFYPPAPTFDGAFVGGTIATNAAGAQTFRHGATRAWVEGLSVMLASGLVLDIERGACRAALGRFEVEDPDGSTLSVPAPSYPLPAVPKCSAGYHAGNDLDLVDLFIGSEGTLGIVLEATLRILPREPMLTAWISCPGEGDALALAAALRAAAPSLVSIEYLDARCLELLREADPAAAPPPAGGALLVQLAAADDGAQALQELLAAAGDDLAADAVLVAMPGERAAAARFFRWREAVPVLVNHRIAAAQRSVDPGVQKLAADMIVPFAHLREMQAEYRRTFTARGLDHAIWGHVSDANLHANVLPRSLAEYRSGREALLELADRAIAFGGSPLSEHGVGRNPLKQEMLRRLHGEEGIAAMRAVKQALDPGGKLAPGVLFQPSL